MIPPPRFMPPNEDRPRKLLLEHCKFASMEPRRVPHALTRRLGSWSAVVAGAATAASMFTLAATGSEPWTDLPTYAARFADFKLLSFVLWFVLGIAFVPVVASVHAVTREAQRPLSLTALAFAIMYATIVSVNYALQFTFVRQSLYRGEIEGLEPWVAANPTSAIFAVDILAYMFQGLSTLFLAPLFHGGRLAAAVRWLFVVNGLLGIGGLVAIALISFGSGEAQWVGVVSLLVWGTLLTIALFLLAYGFSRGLFDRLGSTHDAPSAEA